MNTKKVNPKNIKLDQKSIKLRLNIVNALEKYRRGHIGPAFSCLEIIRVIFNKHIKEKKNHAGLKLHIIFNNISSVSKALDTLNLINFSNS